MSSLLDTRAMKKDGVGCEDQKEKPTIDRKEAQKKGEARGMIWETRQDEVRESEGVTEARVPEKRRWTEDFAEKE